MVRDEKLKKRWNILLKKISDQFNNGEVIGYDQNYMKHHIPMIGLPIGEIVTQ